MFIKIKCFLVMFLWLGFTVNLYAQERLVGHNDPNVPVGSGQAEIVINAENATQDIAVWVNGVIAAHVRPRTSERIIVHNGQNSIEVASTQVRRGQWNIGTRRQLMVNANSNRTIISLVLRYGAVVNLNVQGTTAIGGGPALTPPPAAIPPPPPPVARAPAARAPAARAPVTGGNPIELAVIRAVDVLVNDLPDGATVAVLSVSSNDPEISSFVIDEKIFLLVSSRRFTVVDRASLDLIRSEMDFQFSGDVDDSSAVSIGRMLGASIVITGDVTLGTFQRLRARALDVQSARIMAMASESF